MKNQILYIIPNSLSFSRLCLGLFFPFVPEHAWIWLVICGGASDALDGWIAKRWNLTSWQGGLLDATADKVFVLSALLTFMLAGKFSIIWIPFIVARDLSVTIIAGYTAMKRAWNSFRIMDARWSGKIATIGQFLFLLVVILLPKLTEPALYFTVAVSFIAAADYIREFIKALLAQPDRIPS